MTTEALTSAYNYWRLSLRRPAGANLVVRAQSHLITPMDLGPFLLGSPVQRWILMHSPLPEGLERLFPSSFGWLLRRQPPVAQVATHGTLGQLHAPLLLD